MVSHDMRPTQKVNVDKIPLENLSVKINFGIFRDTSSLFCCIIY